MLIFRKRILAFSDARFREFGPWRAAALILLLGRVLDVLVSLSVGAGAVGPTAIILLYPACRRRAWSASTSPMRGR
jgi:hypothetical protein